MTIKVPFQANTRNANRKIKQLNRNISGTGTSSQRAGRVSNTAYRGIAKAAGLAAVAIGSIVSASKGIAAADNVTALSNRISAFSDNSTEAASRMRDVVRVSKDQFQSLDALGKLYSRLQISTKDLGTSQKDLANFVEAFAAGARITSASTTEASAAAIQLSQALASGELRGEEFRSVMEQTPRVAIALAKGLGVTTGELRKMANSGQLISSVVIPALNSQLEILREESSRIAPTLGEIRAGFGISFALASAQIDKTTGALGGIRGGINKAKAGLDTFTKTLKGGGSVGLALADGIIKGAKSGIAAAIGFFSSIDFGGLAKNLGTAIGTVLRGFIGFFANIKVGDLSGLVASLRDAAIGFGVTIFNNVKGALDGIDFTRFGLRFADTIINSLAGLLEIMGTNFAFIMNKVIGAVNALLDKLRYFSTRVPALPEKPIELPKSNLEGKFKGKGDVFTGVGGDAGESGSGNAIADFFAEITASAQKFRIVADSLEEGAGKANEKVTQSNIDLSAAGNSAASAIGQLASITGNSALAALDAFINTFKAVNSLVVEFGKILSSMNSGDGGGGFGAMIAGLFGAAAGGAVGGAGGGAGGGTGGGSGPVLHKAKAGGIVVPGTGTGDKIRALLEPGEIIIPNRSKDRDALMGGGGGNVTFALEGGFDERSQRSIRKMIQTGMLQNTLNGSNIQNGGQPVFKAA